MTSVENFPILSPLDLELINKLNNIPSSGVTSDLKKIYPSGLILDVHTPTVMGGINLGMMTTNINGLLCIIEPFLNMQNSSYTVMLGGVEVASGTITQADESFVPFYIKPAQVYSLLGGQESGIYELYARILRPVSQNEEETPRLTVKIDLLAPGGFDPDPSTPEHDKLLPVTANLGNPGVIGASDIDNGVTFEVPPYEGMALFDTVTLSVGGRLVTRLLESVNDVGSPVTILVGPADLQGLPDKAEVVVIYRPHDETHNPSTWSRRGLFLVERTAGLLDPPQFEDESLDLPRSTIDLAALLTTTTAVIVSTGRLAVGESVTLTWRLTLATGRTLSGQQTQVVVSRRENLVFDVPQDQAVTLGAGRLVVSYVAAQSGRSSSAVANLINELVGAGPLPTPIIPQTNGTSELNLATFVGNAHAQVVPWPRIAVGQRYWWRATFRTTAGEQAHLLASSTVSSGDLTQGLRVSLERTLLQSVVAGSNLRISLRVAFKGEDESLATLFPEPTVVVTGQLPLSLGGAHSQAVAASYIIAQGRPPKMPAASANAVFNRGASGGVPPYSYQSNNSAVATVDQSGRVVAAGNGTAQITVTDSAGNRASYAISFSGVRTVRREDSRWWVPSPQSDVRRPQNYALTRAQMRQFWEQYRGEAPSLSVPAILGWPVSYYWTSENIATNDHAWAVDFQSLSPNFNGTSFQGGNKFAALYRNSW